MTSAFGRACSWRRNFTGDLGTALRELDHISPDRTRPLIARDDSPSHHLPASGSRNGLLADLAREAPSTSTRPCFIGQSAQRTIPCARPVAACPRGNRARKAKTGHPVHGHISAYFIGGLILLLLTAFAVFSRRGFPQPSCKYEDGGGRTLGHGGFASIGLPPSPLVPKRPARRKPFILNSAGRANRWAQAVVR